VTVLPFRPPKQIRELMVAMGAYAAAKR